MSETVTEQTANSIDQHEGCAEVDQACPECGTTNLRRTCDGAETICDSCGLVVEEPETRTTEQWQARVAERRRDQVDPPLTGRLHDKGLTTTIDWRDKDAYGTPLPPEKRRRINRLRTHQQRCRVQGSGERNLRFAFGEIDRIASEVELPGFIREAANATYRRVHSAGLVGGYATEALAASTLYIVCRSNDLPRPMTEIAAASRVEKRAIGRAYREVARELDINLEPVDPRKYLPQLCSALDCSEQVRTAAAGILEIVAERGAFAGKSPMGLAAASVYLASLRCDEKQIQRDVAAVAGISVATLRSRYHELLSP